MIEMSTTEISLSSILWEENVANGVKAFRWKLGTE
jgi:hypothetical protein